MIDSQLLQELEDNDCLIADGFDDALIGITEGNNPVAVYDTDKCIQILMREDEMNEEDAVDFFYFNTVGAYVGEKTPLFLRMFDNEYYRTL
tara:strand:- start:555 stop:827 length:273 start_codon:yes stop_codon:yes gene_type:complete